MGNEKIRKWDEIKGMPVEGYEKRINADEVTDGEPVLCRNPLKTVEELAEQNYNHIDGVINNVATIDCSFMERKILEIAMLQFQRQRKAYKKKDSHFCVLERELV